MRRSYRNRNKKRINLISSDQKKLTNSLKIFIFILIIFFIFTTIFYYLKNSIYYKNIVESSKQEIEDELKKKEEQDKEKDEESVETDTTFTLTSIGDIMCHNTQYMDAYDKSTNNYDFSYVFNDISYYTKTGDLCIGNIETTFAGEERGYSNYPTFNSPDALAYNLKNIGIDIITTAGNHCLDTGYSGLSRTLDVLDDADIAHLGTYKTQEDQDKVFTKYVKGVKIAFIDYTYGTNGIPIPSDKPFCVNLINKDLIKKQIESAKEEGFDVLVACMHWGVEYKTTPTDEQEELADFLFQNGVDIILGNHPHVLEPMEKRTITLEDGTKKDGFVIYAHGNFICDQNLENTRNSIILNLSITKHTDGKITIDKANYIPIYMYKANTSNLKRMKLIDIRKAISEYEDGSDTSIGDNLYNLLKIQLDKITNIVGPEIN